MSAATLEMSVGGQTPKDCVTEGSSAPSPSASLTRHIIACESEARATD